MGRALKLKPTKKEVGKIVNVVSQSKDYTIFKFRKDNRTVIDSHVKTLIKSMEQKGWITGSYVVVNSNMEIIDGQHRVVAATLVGVPINYVVEHQTGADEIRGLNTAQRNWAIVDHLHGFVVENNPHYVALQNFMKEYPTLNVTECIMLTQNTLGTTNRKTFEMGDFKVNNMVLAREWADNIMKLKPHFSGYNRSIFVRALVKVLSRKPEFDFNDFVRKIEVRPSMIHYCGTVTQYVEMIERIYNFQRKTSERLNLRF